MKVYLAGSSRDAAEVDHFAQSVGKFGVNVISSWHKPKAFIGFTPDKIWSVCLSEVDQATHLVVFPAQGTKPLRGAIYEAGYALAQGKKVIVIEGHDNGDWQHCFGIDLIENEVEVACLLIEAVQNGKDI